MAPTRATPTAALHTEPPIRPPAYTQGVYWVVTGIWPLVHRRSFEWVTGPKIDYWLVELVGLLLAVVGGAMIVARARGRITGELGFVVIGSILALIGISVFYGAHERISPVYLVEAAVEVIFLAGWLRWAFARPTHRVVAAPAAAGADLAREGHAPPAA